ncbi:CopG family transcriptional regulator [Archaeoglobales archaeon]|nr:MAG: CopG family transcriptional regulator [Archaeoglobales archaeon]
MNQNEYTTIRLPKELVDEIDDIVKDRSKGYTSRAEFVKEAIRIWLMKIKQGRGR